MDWKRLFHVLVVGGSVLASKGCGGKDEDKGEARDAATLSDATAAPEDTGGDAPADAATSPPADAGLDAADDAGDAAVEVGNLAPDASPEANQSGAPNCFCGTNPKCCVVHGDGMSVPADGVVCCWNTRCP